MLVLIATPIGNLSDISQNALEHLRSCDYVLCEDTRHSKHLLQHYEIQKPLRSYHKFSEAKSLESIVCDLLEGKKICLVSDAGTPCISDPGALLVDACHKKKIKVTICPGPSAPVSAMALCGFLADKHQFIGFLPKQESTKKQTLIEALSYKGVTVFFESAQRLLETLACLSSLSPTSHLFVARELTKKYEELARGSCKEIFESYSVPPKGELVLCLQPDPASTSFDLSCMTEQKHVEYLQKAFLLSKKEAIKLAAEQRGIRKQDLYKKFITNTP